MSTILRRGYGRVGGLPVVFVSRLNLPFFCFFRSLPFQPFSNPWLPLHRTAEQLSKTFHTNVIGVVLVTEALIPLLRLKNTKIVYNISSWMGSIGNNGGGAMSYRVSKTALNMGGFDR